MGGHMNRYASDPYYEETYFFDDPSLYGDYITELEASGVSAEEIRGYWSRLSTGTNNVDSINKSSDPNSWSLYGYSGNDSIVRQAHSMAFCGEL